MRLQISTTVCCLGARERLRPGSQRLVVLAFSGHSFSRISSPVALSALGCFPLSLSSYCHCCCFFFNLSGFYNCYLLDNFPLMPLHIADLLVEGLLWAHQPGGETRV